MNRLESTVVKRLAIRKVIRYNTCDLFIVKSLFQSSEVVGKGDSNKKGQNSGTKPLTNSRGKGTATSAKNDTKPKTPNTPTKGAKSKQQTKDNKATTKKG